MLELEISLRKILFYMLAWHLVNWHGHRNYAKERLKEARPTGWSCWMIIASIIIHNHHHPQHHPHHHRLHRRRRRRRRCGIRVNATIVTFNGSEWACSYVVVVCSVAIALDLDRHNPILLILRILRGCTYYMRQAVLWRCAFLLTVVNSVVYHWQKSTVMLYFMYHM